MKRTVQYWRLIGPDGKPLAGKFPVGQVVRRLCAAEAADQNRYRRCRDGMVLLAKGVAEPDHRMIVLDKVRRENLPSVGDPIGARRAIPLGADEGLLEPTYCLFTARNIIAMLTSGDGPRPRRLVDYLSAKLDIEVGIEPVLTQNLDDVLAEMRISEIQVAIPVSRIDRNLIGGDWIEALDGARLLAQDGVVRIGMSVGRRGTRVHKESIRARLSRRVADLRGSGALSEFDSARVSGTVSGSPRTVDLLEDRFVEKTDVDADRLNDPQRSIAYAREVLGAAVTKNKEYLKSVVEPLPQGSVSFPDTFIDTPGDEQR